jgi:hypothetical protein
MWYPESTSDWVIVGYLLIGLIYGAYVYHSLNSEHGREEAEKHAGPLPPEIFRIGYAVLCLVLVFAILIVWPIAMGWEFSKYVMWKRRK